MHISDMDNIPQDIGTEEFMKYQNQSGALEDWELRAVLPRVGQLPGTTCPRLLVREPLLMAVLGQI